MNRESDSIAHERPVTADPSEPTAHHAIAGDDCRLIDSAADLDAFLDEMAAGNDVRCSVDTEADSLHSYREKLCLIQIAWAGRVVLVDPLGIDPTSLRRVIDVFRDAEVWMHGADFDMLMLQRTFGEIPRTIFDTQVAARLVGMRRFGLSALIEEVFGVTLSKSSQRADWGKRPLPAKMIDYAANDVRYLLALADHLMARLRELGRMEWFLESCRAAQESFLSRPERSDAEAWRISGWGRLEQKGLLHLRELWRWRDAEAERLDRPPFKVVGNDHLLALAEQLQRGQPPSIPRFLRPDLRRRLERTIDRTASIPQEDWPPRKLKTGPRGPRLEEDPEAFQALRRHRDETADRLEIDPTLIATRSALETISIDPAAVDPLLMSWQRQLMEPGIAALHELLNARKLNPPATAAPAPTGGRRRFRRPRGGRGKGPAETTSS